jgi:hypothetical protein
MSEVSIQKKQYERPKLASVGAVGDVTLATNGSERLDGAFDAGTPLTEVTTS